MAANAGQVLTCERLLKRVWGKKGRGDLRPMGAVVSRLCRRQGNGADHPAYVFTEPRVGYWVLGGEGPDLTLLCSNSLGRCLSASRWP